MFADIQMALYLFVLPLFITLFCTYSYIQYRINKEKQKMKRISTTIDIGTIMNVFDTFSFNLVSIMELYGKNKNKTRELKRTIMQYSKNAYIDSDYALGCAIGFKSVVLVDMLLSNYKYKEQVPVPVTPVVADAAKPPHRCNCTHNEPLTDNVVTGTVTTENT